MEHEARMRLALEEARLAAAEGEVPVGCVIVDADGNVIGRGRNRREQKKSALAHAEIEAIEQACRAKSDWRLTGCSLYVTLEPCPMCAGAAINARIARIYYGAREEYSGSCGSVFNMFVENLPNKPQVYGGILEGECAALLSEFFRSLRLKGQSGSGLPDLSNSGSS
jgi:tRNA(adenine34) deaminase